mgnify:CR=1 FL=1
MDYYHLQVRMKVDKKVSLLWKRSDEFRCTADSNESQKGCRSVIWPENLGSVSLGSRWLSLLPRLKFDELLGCEVWSGLLIGTYWRSNWWACEEEGTNDGVSGLSELYWDSSRSDLLEGCISWTNLRACLIFVSRVTEYSCHSYDFILRIFRSCEL